MLPGLRLCAAVLALAGCAEPLHAQTPAEFYRGKAVRLVNGGAAGSGYDLYSRMLAPYLEKKLGATVVANTLHVLQAKVVTLTPAPVKEAAGRTRQAFRAKPWMTTAVALSLSSFILNLIAFFVRWVTFSNGGSVRNKPLCGWCERFSASAYSNHDLIYSD